MFLNARTLLRIAVAMDLPWRPSTNGDYVVLTRAGMVIEQDTVKDAVSEQLAAQGITGKYALGFTSSFPQVVLPADMAQQVEVSSLVAKPEKNIFEATIAAPSQANPVQTFRIIGTMHRLIEVPVLSETLDRGMIIGARDIQMIEMREDSLKNGMVVSAQSLIGMTPRRMIVSGQPVDLSSVEPPRSVERGDLVTMVFQDGPLTLTAQAKAMENGATGDVIRVVNVSSNKTLEAEVTASKEVTVKNF